MRRTTIHPNVNASLIHEIRMIVESFFLTRSFSLGSKKSPALKCASCLKIGNPKPQVAVTISNGQAVCQAHLI